MLSLSGSIIQQTEGSLFLLASKEEELRQTDLLEPDLITYFCLDSYDSLIESGFPGLMLLASNHDMINERLSDLTN